MKFSGERIGRSELRVALLAVALGCFGVGAALSLGQPARDARQKNIEDIEDAIERDGFQDPFVDNSRLYAKIVFRGCDLHVRIDVEGGTKRSSTEYDPVVSVSYSLKIESIDENGQSKVGDLNFMDSVDLDSQVVINGCTN